MRRWLLVILLLLLAAPALARTIEQDTRWSGDLSFAETVRVPPEVMLTIAPGSRIHFDGGGLEVSGRLVAEQAVLTGTDWDGLVLKNLDTASRLVAVEVTGANTGILVQGGSLELSDLTLRNNRVGLELRGKAGGSVSGSRFVDNRKVGLFVKDESTTRVRNCEFSGNARFGAYIYRAKPVEFSSNRFAGNGTGLMVAYHGTDPLVAGNVFTDNDIAVQVDRAARPVLSGNRLNGNRTGFYLYRRADPVVTGNLIAGNSVGILVGYSSYPQISGNDLVGNGLAIKLEFQSSTWEQAKGEAARNEEVATRGAFGGQGMRTVTEDQRRAQTIDGTVAARDNWWGDEGTRELERIGAGGNPGFIHDGRDQATFNEGGSEYPLDRVSFAPWRRSPQTEFSR